MQSKQILDFCDIKKIYACLWLINGILSGSHGPHMVPCGMPGPVRVEAPSMSIEVPFIVPTTLDHGFLELISSRQEEIARLIGRIRPHDWSSWQETTRQQVARAYHKRYNYNYLPEWQKQIIDTLVDELFTRIELSMLQFIDGVPQDNIRFDARHLHVQTFILPPSGILPSIDFRPDEPLTIHIPAPRWVTFEEERFELSAHIIESNLRIRHYPLDPREKLKPEAAQERQRAQVEAHVIPLRILQQLFSLSLQFIMQHDINVERGDQGNLVITLTPDLLASLTTRFPEFCTMTYQIVLAKQDDHFIVTAYKIEGEKARALAKVLKQKKLHARQTVAEAQAKEARKTEEAKRQQEVAERKRLSQEREKIAEERRKEREQREAARKKQEEPSTSSGA